MASQGGSEGGASPRGTTDVVADEAVAGDRKVEAEDGGETAPLTTAVRELVMALEGALAGADAESGEATALPDERVKRAVNNILALPPTTLQRELEVAHAEQRLWAAIDTTVLAQPASQACTEACRLLHALLTSTSASLQRVTLRHIPAMMLAVVRCSQLDLTTFAASPATAAVATPTTATAPSALEAMLLVAYNQEVKRRSSAAQRQQHVIRPLSQESAFHEESLPTEMASVKRVFKEVPLHPATSVTPVNQCGIFTGIIERMTRTLPSMLPHARLQFAQMCEILLGPPAPVPCERHAGPATVTELTLGATEANESKVAPSVPVPVVAFANMAPALIPRPLPVPVPTACLRGMLEGLRFSSVSHATSLTVMSILRASKAAKDCSKFPTTDLGGCVTVALPNTVAQSMATACANTALLALHDCATEALDVSIMVETATLLGT